MTQTSSSTVLHNLDEKLYTDYLSGLTPQELTRLTAEYVFYEPAEKGFYIKPEGSSKDIWVEFEIPVDGELFCCTEEIDEVCRAIYSAVPEKFSSLEEITDGEDLFGAVDQYAEHAAPVITDILMRQMTDAVSSVNEEIERIREEE